MKILFMCVYNRFRSQLAEGFFKKYNKNKKIQVSSAGLIKGRPVAKTVKKIAKKFGIKTNYPKNLDENSLRKKDTIILVTEEIPKNLFKMANIKKVIKWPVKDQSQKDINAIEQTAKAIKLKVLGLIKYLEKEVK